MEPFDCLCEPSIYSFVLLQCSARLDYFNTESDKVLAGLQFNPDIIIV